MRKMWIKKESLYHKPFYKQKLKMTMLSVLLMGIVFLAYQVFSVNQLQLNNGSTAAAAASSSSSAIGSTSSLAADGHHHNVREQPVPNGAPAVVDLVTLSRGIRERDMALYMPNVNRTFRCLHSGEVLAYAKVNDDYCDCADGSDEPATNACPNGVFYCAYRTRHPRASVSDRQTFVPNSRINDGICDCCDGSDEWLPRRKGGSVTTCPQHCS